MHFRFGFSVLKAILAASILTVSPKPLAAAEADGSRSLHKETTVTQRTSMTTQPETSTAAIRPFRSNVPKEALVDLRRRIAATRWPDRETVTDRSQGVQLARIQALVRYWGTDYDWRKAEAKLNALPQFMTTIDGLDIHFIHVRSRRPNACRSSSPTGGRAQSWSR